jgi:hypothetical protein
LTPFRFGCLTGPSPTVTKKKVVGVFVRFRAASTN